MNNVATIQDQLIGNKEEVLIIVESNTISLFSLLLRHLLLLIILYCVVVCLLSICLFEGNLIGIDISSYVINILCFCNERGDVSLQITALLSW